MKIFIKNLNQSRNGVRCDRIGAYGNPFELFDPEDSVARDNVCNAYHDFFYRVVVDLYDAEEALSIVSGLYDVKVSSTWKNYSKEQIIVAIEDLVQKAIAEDNKESDIGELTLLCWCNPKRCHTETIREYLKYRVIQEREKK